MTDETREIRQSSRMTETEALMWAAESDPWLSSGMGSVFILDTAPEFGRFVETMERASHTLLRLRERVVDGLGIAPPSWVVDEEFDIHEHVRHVKLPSPGGVRELLDVAAQVFQDPFDVHRPLWQFIAVEGSGGRKRTDSVPGGIIMKLHHSVSDGIGALRLAEMYLDFEREPSPPSEDATAAKVVAGNPRSKPRPKNVVDAALGELDYVARQQLELARRAVAEVSLWGADRGRIRKAADQAAATVKSVVQQSSSPQSPDSGSPLWSTRSRHRHLEVFDVPLDELRAAAKRRGGSVNDLFVAGSALAASRYHEERGAAVDAFNLSFIVSTRADDAAGGNSFAPIPFSIPGSPMTAADTFHSVKLAMLEKRDELSSSPADAMNLMIGMATMLPDSMISKAGRARAAKHDWATSNLRGAPIPIFTAGGQITHMYPVGPLGGTAFNLTAMSYCGTLFFGVFIDPRAVDDPASLRSHLIAAYADLVS
ncbi:MAG: diacylglycerol O-acyltransferase [Verrucomicrobiales bacterium]|jgi:diacylglycerol O-acyltransferase